MIDVVMPQMGESIVEGTLTKWLKKAGDRVERDEPLFEISTDKVDTEIPAPSAGVLKELLVEEGKTVAINTVVARIDEGGDGAGAQAPPAEAQAPPPAAAPAPAPAQPAPAQEQPKAEAFPPTPGVEPEGAITRVHRNSRPRPQRSLRVRSRLSCARWRASSASISSR
jgi:2-oxoglutarate dehydrogenase E2 component (dihydrolipoamide succinyltransferase)